MRTCFTAWRELMRELLVKYLATENETLMSIWKMGKADLVCLAQTEAGMSRAVAQSGTVTMLRVMIREYREMQEYVQAGHRLPQGLNRITHAELLHTFEQWGVATKDSGKRRYPPKPGTR